MNRYEAILYLIQNGFAVCSEEHDRVVRFDQDNQKYQYYDGTFHPPVMFWTEDPKKAVQEFLLP